jgi:SAM-dependent methyltransferase
MLCNGRTRVSQNHFGDDVAETYDADVSGEFDPAVIASIVSFLADGATDGSALEFGIGTGRIALPLHHLGLDVEGIDLSSSMVERMRRKPGGGDIRVVLGDFASTSMDRTFDLAYLVFNTIMNLTTQEEQVACFANAAAHLRPGGRFVVEVMIPDLRRLPPGEKFRPFNVQPDALGFDEYDVANQGLVSHHYRIHDDRMEVHSIPFRYVWPSELDLMASMAGMALRGRWSGWTREPFTSESLKHVSVWEKLP